MLLAKNSTMNLLLVAATPFEIKAYTDYLDQNFIKTQPFRYQKGEVQVAVLITGVGLPLTAYALGSVLNTSEWTLVINAGVAGAIDPALKIGDVVQVTSERFADLGVEEADGQFTDVHQMGLIEADQPPFQNGRLVNKDSNNYAFLPGVHGISVNKVHGTTASIAALTSKYPDAQTESMEGAAFFYACLLHNIPFLEIRSISNYVEARNRDNWDLPLAIAQLNNTLIELTKVLFVSS
jgi:futalosine hydrolase